MKEGLKQVVGKRIAAVVVAESGREPRQQVFLVFPDGTSLELYGSDFTCCRGLDSAAGIGEYVECGKGRITKVYGEAALLEPPAATGGEAPAGDTIEALLTRDLLAWRATQAALRKARRR